MKLDRNSLVDLGNVNIDRVTKEGQRRKLVGSNFGYVYRDNGRF